MKIVTLIKHFLKKKEGEIERATSEAASFVTEEALIIKKRIEAKKSRQKRLRVILGSMLFLVIIFGAIAAYSQYQLRTLSRDELLVDIPKDKQPRTGEEIIKALGRHVVLPPGNPQIAEVQDAAKLKIRQAFFENAENGDVVVVYDSYIYLYRPAQDIVVSSGDISITGQ